jgi:hypothetical protein
VGIASYSLFRPRRSLRWGIRAGFLSLIGGLMAYAYIALGLPGSEPLIQGAGTAGVAAIALAGAILGSLAAFLWRLSVLKSPKD